jgi:integrase
MPSINLNQKTLESLKPHSERRDFWDSSLKGFVLRVSPDGIKVFSVYYRIGGKQRRMTLGPYGELSLAAARDRARDALELVRKGIDPAEEQKRQEAAEVALRAEGFKFSGLAAQYLEEYAKLHKKSWQEDERLLNRLLLPEFGARNVKDISRSDVRSFLRGLAAKTPVQANRALACIRKIFSWGIKEEVIDVESNPASNISAPGGREKPKDRTLTDFELKRVWNELDKESSAVDRALQLILVTGQRPGEVAGLRWDELDLNDFLWTIPAARAKNGCANIVPLSDIALRIIRRQRESIETQNEKRQKREKKPVADEYVFPCRTVANVKPMLVYSLDQAAQNLSANLEIPSFTPHDLRRTCATRLGALQVPGHVIARILNHKQKDITSAVYNQYQYLNEKREALNLWAVRLSRLTSGLELVRTDNGNGGMSS